MVLTLRRVAGTRNLKKDSDNGHNCIISRTFLHDGTLHLLKHRICANVTKYQHHNN